MLNRNLFILTFLFFGQLCLAQSAIGVQFGFKNSNYRYLMNYSDLQPTAATSGYSAGIYYEKAIGEGLMLKPELNFASRGFRLDKSSEGIDQIMTQVNLNFMESALMLNWGSSSNNMAPFFELGPKISYAFGRSVEQHSPETDETFKADMVSPLEIGFVIGAGFKLPMGQSHIKLFLRYEMGLNNTHYLGSKDITLRSRALSFGTGIELFKPGTSKKYCNKSSCL